MAARSLASLSISFGLVSIPVKVHLATESAAAVSFKLMAHGGARVRQQYVADSAPEPVPPEAPPSRPSKVSGSVGLAWTTPSQPTPLPAAESGVAPPRVQAMPAHEPAQEIGQPMVVERGDMLKGYEFERGKFVLFTSAELSALASQSRQTIDIVSFVPTATVDPIYYEKAYFLTPDKRGEQAYSLLMQAMAATGRSALAKWAWRSKEYVVLIRPVAEGLVLQQLFYADEVRSLHDLRPRLVKTGADELRLACQIIEQLGVDRYDPSAFVDEEKQRVLAAVERKIAGQEVVSPNEVHAQASAANVVDLMSALRASLLPDRAAPTPQAAVSAAERKGMRRAAPARSLAEPARKDAGTRPPKLPRAV